MIKLNLERIFKARGISGTNQFLIAHGQSSNYAYRLVNNKVISIPFEKLEQLCIAFNCMPNDLFDYIPDKNHQLAQTHALHGLSKGDTIGEVNKLLHQLPMEKIVQLYGILKEGDKNPE